MRPYFLVSRFNTHAAYICRGTYNMQHKPIFRFMPEMPKGINKITIQNKHIYLFIRI